MMAWLPSALMAHLWQSTWFAAVVWLAALVLRHHSARLRYWLWTAASLKTSPLAPAHCLDAAYIEMRTSRMKLLPGPPGAPDPGEQLKRYCAAQARK